MYKRQSLYTADDPDEYDDISRKKRNDRQGITKILRCTIFLFKGTGSRKYLSALWPVSYTHLDVYKRQEYQKEIYENYGLLMLDCAYGSGNFAIENVEKRLQEKNLNNLKQSEKELYEMCIRDRQGRECREDLKKSLRSI